MGLLQRICAAFEDQNARTISYYDLARLVWPKDQYPNAFNYPTRGGPPGCYMWLSRALREHGIHWSLPKNATNMIHAMISRPAECGPINMDLPIRDDWIGPPPKDTTP